MYYLFHKYEHSMVYFYFSLVARVVMQYIFKFWLLFICYKNSNFTVIDFKISNMRFIVGRNLKVNFVYMLSLFFMDNDAIKFQNKME